MSTRERLAAWRRPCSNCGQPKSLTGSCATRRCRRCHAYWQHHGREHPLPVVPRRVRYAPETPCGDCGRTDRPLWRRRCPACYMVAWRAGRVGAKHRPQTEVA